MKKKIIVTIILVIVLVVAMEIFFNNKEKVDENQEQNENKAENNINNYETVEEIKQQSGITGETENYDVITEYDGRKTLVIKPSIEIDTVFAGIIKGEKPEKEEIAEYKKQKPTKNGIWINKTVREKFLEQINSLTNCEYEVDENGYLRLETEKEKNKYDEKLIEMIKRDKITIVDISQKCYILDEVTAQVTEYPFEIMDPYQAYERFEDENTVIYILTTNKEKKIETNEILEQFLLSE